MIPSHFDTIFCVVIKKKSFKALNKPNLTKKTQKVANDLEALNATLTSSRSASVVLASLSLHAYLSLCSSL